MVGQKGETAKDGLAAQTGGGVKRREWERAETSRDDDNSQRVAGIYSVRRAMECVQERRWKRWSKAGRGGSGFECLLEQICDL